MSGLISIVQFTINVLVCSLRCCLLHIKVYCLCSSLLCSSLLSMVLFTIWYGAVPWEQKYCSQTLNVAFCLDFKLYYILVILHHKKLESLYFQRFMTLLFCAKKRKMLYCLRLLKYCPLKFFNYANVSSLMMELPYSWLSKFCGLVYVM